MHRNSYVPALLTLALGLSSFGCSEEEGVRTLRVRGAFAPDAVDFGEVPLNTSRSLAVTLKNTGELPMPIEAIDVPAGFSVQGLKAMPGELEVRPGESMDLTVVFLPLTEGEQVAQIVLTTGGGDVQVVLEVRGVGVIVAAPMMTVAPAQVDFGVVAIGDTGRATVQVTNSGTADGTIEGFTLASGGGATFAVGTALPVTVPVGGSASLELVFVPDQEMAVSDVIQLQAGAHPALEVTVSGQGLVPLGDITCTPGRVEFGQVERGTTATLPVTCTAQGGPARLITASVNGRDSMFSLPSPPSTTDLTAGGSVAFDVLFTPDGLPAPVQDVLTVQYNGGNGAASTTVNLVGEVIPPPAELTALAVKLQWGSNGSDVDIHLVGPGGRFFEAPLDCYFGNDNPDWGVQGDSSDDPFLDRDDLDGFGPEEINLSAVAPGDYDVYVHFWDDHNTGPTDATLEVFIGGNLAATRTRSGLRCSQVWHVGTVNWNGMTGSFIPRDAIDIRNIENCLF